MQRDNDCGKEFKKFKASVIERFKKSKNFGELKHIAMALSATLQFAVLLIEKEELVKDLSESRNGERSKATASNNKHRRTSKK